MTDPTPEPAGSPAPPAPAAPQGAEELARKQARTWGMVCHLAALSAFLGVPFGHIVGPLVVWLIKKDEIPLVEKEGRKALNFQISVTIYAVAAGLLCLVFIGFVLLPAVLIFSIVCSVMAAIRTNEGVDWSYPLSLTFLR